MMKFSLTYDPLTNKAVADTATALSRNGLSDLIPEVDDALFGDANVCRSFVPLEDAGITKVRVEGVAKYFFDKNTTSLRVGLEPFAELALLKIKEIASQHWTSSESQREAIRHTLVLSGYLDANERQPRDSGGVLDWSSTCS
jgi:hypothetical protein